MKVAVVGTGYVGLSNALLLAQRCDVVAVDIDEDKVSGLNQGLSPIDDAEVADFLCNKHLNFSATTDLSSAVEGARCVIVATPTDYDPETNYFDTSSVESVCRQVVTLMSGTSEADQATIIIKSTVPVGFTEELRNNLAYPHLYFSPEFLREGRALYDNLYPSRIIVGADTERARQFADILRTCSDKPDVETLYTGSTEAEAIKLFSNTYLAMRVAYFNELDTYAAVHQLDSRQIIQGVGLDPRIGAHYNNPSFGYGGYCLPKDTRQLLANYDSVPSNLIKAIVDANETRKKFISNLLIERSDGVVGIYRLVMKSGSDNFRASAIIDVIKHLIDAGCELVIYEPTISDGQFMGIDVDNNLNRFKERSSVILANRISDELEDVSARVFSRDIFGKD
ncbi:nucleotide sugar dehydrogenase [Oceanospirillum linum]|uniref:UDP-glucose 6-dehydrogenase n=1 Tax=Oceanospirillum linum TaxID=966 RepID=A0A1T1H7T4_OCELI|nr:nucleotide sugar dehydrogenase [Oceanospirillum linum]OOV85903.1 UDP-glucose 6-dehydrogenase [Oceanospirillum linum]SEG51626.1 UDPglucose 6-dehydrogenase [Oleiphilus messinensis]SMP35646.1 UDPglucose 6-dehydrogenase [Oceanospirillum linum]